MAEGRRFPLAAAGGFTFVEVLIALIIGTLIVGGVMGLTSASLQYSQRIRAKTADWPVLESAAEEILADPRLAEDGRVTLDHLPGSPEVAVWLAEVVDEDGRDLQNPHGKLYRVELDYKGQLLELSIIIPETGLE